MAQECPAWLKEYIYDQFPCDFDACNQEGGIEADWRGFAFVSPPHKDSQVNYFSTFPSSPICT